MICCLDFEILTLFTVLFFIVTDFQFARTSGRNYIGYGSAGDCYSAKNCPQGRFSINLRNTGFRVSSQTQWKTMGGPYAFQNVERKKVW